MTTEAVTTSTTPMCGYVIRTSNLTFERVEAQEGERNLDFYYRVLGVRTIDMVGGYDNSFTMVVDDEALLTDNPQCNRLAEGFLLALNGDYRRIFGDVLIVGGADDEGNTLPLPHGDFLTLRRRLELFLAAQG